MREEMRSKIETMLDKGVIRKSHSPWSAPAILVRKKSADGKPKYRFCVDFRALNSVTKFDSYHCQILKKPCPPYMVQNTLGSLISILGSGSYTSLNHIKREPLSTSRLDITNFQRLPFGLVNNPANFQRLMDTVLRNLIGPECWAFIDDIVIFSAQ